MVCGRHTGQEGLQPRLVPLLEEYLCLKALPVSLERGNGDNLSSLPESDQAAFLGDVPDDFGGFPALGVANVRNPQVVVLAPKEGDGAERLAFAKHVSRRRLSLPFGNHPVFDASRRSRLRTGPAGNVPGGKNTR